MMKTWLLILGVIGTSIVPQATAEEIDFNRDIRPILSDRCFACHGPDAETREAELRLDLRDAATGGSVAEHAAIVPGDAAESEVFRRITAEDSFELMPPPEFGKPLSAKDIRLLKQWIDEGAKYDQHWSLKPVRRPDVPRSPGETVENPIDAFIQRKLQAENLKLSPQADSRTLIRRIAFDLTGLPPNEALQQRIEQPLTDAEWQSTVGQLLQSPHYGERMAMYWLDLVRYADTLGYHGDQVRSVSPYRDYVINAFNSNKPFDEFTTEQLAGDLLPDPTLWQKVATTYNRLNRASGEGGVQPKEYLAKYSADRVRTTGNVWLGSTFGCAECHDHKFDPFTAHDFYSFAAFFADIKEQGIVGRAKHIELLPVPTAYQASELQQLTTAIGSTREELQASTPELMKARRAWEQSIQQASEAWTVVAMESATSQFGAKLTKQDDHSILASGKNPDKDVYRLKAAVPELRVRATGSESDSPVFFALKIELMTDPTLPQKGPGRASNGNLVLHQARVQVNGQAVKWSSAKASHNQNGHAAQHVATGHKRGWAILPQTGKPQQIVLWGKLPPSDADEAALQDQLEIELHHNHGGGHNLGRFRLSVSTDPAAKRSLENASAEVIAIAALPEPERTAEQTKQLESAFRVSTPLLEDARNRLAKLEAQKDSLEKSIVTTLATTATEPRPIRVLPRGNWMDDSGDIVEPAFPHFLPTSVSTENRLTRLDLARWMTAEDNPLVARTFVNRLWMLMFGQGLSRTVDDLGSQGSPPTHPELLDWLAAEFVDSGWDVKHILRLIVTSKTYRQTSFADASLRDLDPFNSLYARQSRWRLEAEFIRDNALLVSGLLNAKVGGVSAKPYQPAGYWAQLNFPRRTYSHDADENQYRRGVYTHWQRTFLHPSLLAFDAPAREECTAQRPRSNTPLQSLVLLNDPTYVEAARALATQIVMLEETDFDAKLNEMLQRALMREPRDNERQVLKQLWDRDYETFQKSAESAAKLLDVGQAPVPEGLDQVELAAWTSVARAVLNLHESITRY